MPESAGFLPALDEQALAAAQMPRAAATNATRTTNENDDVPRGGMLTQKV